MVLRSGDVVPNDAREHQRQKYRSQVASALNEEDDPLAVYHQFVQWTVKTYGEKDPSSGLLELLEEATGQFKEDPIYRTDLRYLKLWALYARQMNRSGAISIFSFLVANEIGTSYSALYEDYATLLEQDGRLQDADMMYKKGIKRQVRPLERLKNRYREFQGRTGSQPSYNSPGSSIPNAQVTQFHTTPASTSSTSLPSSSTTNQVILNSTPASRYAVMLAPPAPGKRPEKLRFNMSLLFTDDRVEYCIQESRARSMGLLGKKWPPPLTDSSRFSASSSSSVAVDFNDDGQKSTRLLGSGRKSLMGGGPEPTVTINTKEALADVFGMYNSPEKTTKLAVPGSKYAPLKKIEPVTPVVPLRIAFSRENENGSNAKPPTGFQPFVDENAQPRTTPAAKFTPFVDSKQNRTPLITPRPVLQAKELTTPASNTQRTNSLSLKSVPEEKPSEVVFSKVFTPAQIKPVPLAPLRDVFTDDHGKPLPKPKSILTHERAKSHHDLSSHPAEGSRSSPFTPFLNENTQTPFKVFSRPPEQDSNAGGISTPKTPAVFTPFADSGPAFKPFKDTPPSTFKPFIDQEAVEDKHPLEPSLIAEEPELPRTNSVTNVEESDEEVQEDKVEAEAQYLDQADYEEEDSQLEQYEIPLASEHLPEEYEEEHSYQEVPLGGRFGQFNVMTPITERTFEFTTSTRGATPSGRFGRPLQDGDGSPNASVFIPPRHAEHEAIEAAERLAAELQHKNGEYDEELEASDFIESLHLNQPQRDDPDVALIEERTGSLSLVDTLTLNSKFRPPNPCNPFDPSILSILLSRIPTDPYFHDLRDQPSKRLDELQKFFKKSRKASGSSSNNAGTLETSACFPLTLEGNRFNVSEKIGEGGFGCVFKARDVGTRMSDEDEDEEDYEEEDEEGSSQVALKVVKPRNLWEYHVLRRLHSALPSSLRRSIVLPHALYAYNDESYLVLDFCSQGMLLNIVNNAVAAGVSQAGACLDELLVVFFSIELLRILEGMHSVGIIHGDLKIDNCLLRLEDIPGGNSAWSSIYQPSGEGGWSCKGLKVIDFGRTIDTRLFSPDQQYIAEWPTDERDCPEIRENRPWTYQTDYYGLAGIIYCMLFGKYIQANSVVPVSPGEHRHKLSTPFKRYWQTELWSRLFDVLLNPCLARPNRELPVCDELSALRREMETWLQSNCNRTSNTLKGLLKKVEMSCYVR